MSTIIKIRFFLFLVFCIGSRLTITLFSALGPRWLLRIIGVFALIPVVGWFYIIFIGKRDTGLEVFGEKIWWKRIRPIHMLLWAFFAYMAITGNKNAWIVLLVDTLFGIGAFLQHHYSAGNLSDLI